MKHYNAAYFTVLWTMASTMQLLQHCSEAFH